MAKITTSANDVITLTTGYVNLFDFNKEVLSPIALKEKNDAAYNLMRVAYRKINAAARALELAVKAINTINKSGL